MKYKFLQVSILIVILSCWELLSHYAHSIQPFISSPSRIVYLFIEKTISGDILYHMLTTGYEALLGLIFGLIVGCLLGFTFVYNRFISRITYPYISSLSSIPTFAVAPLMIIWFGTGIGMKIVLAFLSTVFTTAFQVYEGAGKVSITEKTYFEVNGASKKQIFWLLSFPASVDWIIQSLNLNASFCILGAFIGEFIASEAGLGYIILKASGLYDTTYVFVAIICIILLSQLFNLFSYFVNRNKLKIIRFITNKVLNKIESYGK